MTASMAASAPGPAEEGKGGGEGAGGEGERGGGAEGGEVRVGPQSRCLFSMGT